MGSLSFSSEIFQFFIFCRLSPALLFVILLLFGEFAFVIIEACTLVWVMGLWPR